MIRELKKEISDPHHTPRNDLFYNLVRQSMFGDEPLSDEQLQGNIYIFLLYASLLQVFPHLLTFHVVQPELVTVCSQQLPFS